LSSGKKQTPLDANHMGLLSYVNVVNQWVVCGCIGFVWLDC